MFYFSYDHFAASGIVFFDVALSEFVSLAYLSIFLSLLM
jgi:hypothetical protein